MRARRSRPAGVIVRLAVRVDPQTVIDCRGEVGGRHRVRRGVGGAAIGAADHRAARFEEALQIIGPLLRGERLTFAGRYHQLRDAVLLPPPDRPIPILVAGNRPRMLRLTARYADAWNTAWFGLPDERLGQRLAGLHAALQAESRDPATLRRTVGMDCELTDPGQAGARSFAGLADELARAIDAYERLGIDDLIVRLQPSTRPALDRLARAIKIRGH